jgi:hypothetical protein
MSSINLIGAYKKFEFIEKHLNVAGYLPIVKVVSGDARKLLAVVQLTACVAAFFFLGTNPAWVLCKHAFANRIRGKVETSLGLIGVIACLSYDFLCGSFFPYPTHSPF